MSAPDLRKPKDQAYWERNQLVAALSKLFPAWLERHPDSDTKWENDWRWIVFIVIPGKDKVPVKDHGVPGGAFYIRQKRQLSWHIHDSEVKYFSHLRVKRDVNSYDGHTTKEKYSRLTTLKKKWRLL